MNEPFTTARAHLKQSSDQLADYIISAAVCDNMDLGVSAPDNIGCIPYGLSCTKRVGLKNLPCNCFHTNKPNGFPTAVTSACFQPNFGQWIVATLTELGEHAHEHFKDPNEGPMQVMRSIIHNYNTLHQFANV
jgi:hypothetical protein